MAKVLDDVEEVVLGRVQVMILKNDGTLWAYGDNSLGQLGDGKRFFVPRKISTE